MTDYIGKKIRKARKAAGLTQAQLAEKSGVAAITIHQYEAGKRQPRIKQLADITAALNLSVDSLITFEDEVTPGVKDYVPREALIALARPGTFATSCDGAVRQEDAVPVRVIQGVPAADVRPAAVGKWVYDHWCEFKCSNCGAWSKSEPYRGMENFCPNCGAKMSGGTEEEK